MRVALVHDYLMQGMRGAERVLAVLHDLYPQAPVYTLLYDPVKMGSAVDGWDIHTSFLQKLPGAKHLHRNLFALMPLAVELMNLREYDLIISASSAWVKNVRPAVDAKHICYCHSPARFLWSWSEQYIDSLHAGPIAKWLVRATLPGLRWWDRRSTPRVSHFVANSQTVQQRIRRYFGRDSQVIYPPVDTDRFQLVDEDEDYFLIVSALNPYKRVDVAVAAFNCLQLPLLVIGDGPEYERIASRAGPTVQLLGRREDKEVQYHMARCRAFIMPQEEDFGIGAVEAQSAGRPVIAYGAGGALETIVENQTGLFFPVQTPDSLCEAVRRFPGMSFDKQCCRNNALRFGIPRFKKEFAQFISNVTRQ